MLTSTWLQGLVLGSSLVFASTANAFAEATCDNQITTFDDNTLVCREHVRVIEVVVTSPGQTPQCDVCTSRSPDDYFVTTIVIQTPAASTSTATIPTTSGVQASSSTGSTTGTDTGISTISTTATGTVTQTETETGTGTGTGTASPTSTDVPLPSTIGDFALSGCYESTNNFPSFTLAQSSGQMTLAICSSTCASRAFFGVYQTNCYCGDFIDQSTTTPS
ncbi:LOW QUALITY PROTEIN: hypothetical protein NLU13_5878 [Sarocladium strictum]|uniref:WSC domain-containing protein n=1 Tax=Sarocladium strictum TaxID=5046 RepID=A0AA39L687_SARSR|nr:LOW QUALITY PROTEIN: hypothetical protein NLU13_5878 [Sarocladium strictum]